MPTANAVPSGSARQTIRRDAVKTTCHIRASTQRTPVIIAMIRNRFKRRESKAIRQRDWQRSLQTSAEPDRLVPSEFRRPLQLAGNLFHDFVGNIEVGGDRLDVVLVLEGIEQLEHFPAVVGVEFDGIGGHPRELSHLGRDLA